LFLEMLCDDPYILAENFRQKIVNSPDYESISMEEATQDLKMRVKNYEKVYETVTEEKYSYIKMYNLRAKVVWNKVHGNLPRHIGNFINCLHLKTRPIWFVRPAQCVQPNHQEQQPPQQQSPHPTTTPNSSYDEDHENTNSFSQSGEEFTKRLADFVSRRIPERLHKDLIVYTGSSQRLVRTAKHFKGTSTIIQSSLLNKIDPGICNGMAISEIKEKMPEVFNAWEKDRFNFRFPGGESYRDLVQRVKPFVLELEELSVPVLVIANQSTLQVLYTYFKDIPVADSPYYDFPQHTAIELLSTHFGWKENHYKICKS